jgi:hypothetical protein
MWPQSIIIIIIYIYLQDTAAFRVICFSKGRAHSLVSTQILQLYKLI